MKDTKFRSGFVTIIGRPNVGKSTLMNHIIGQKIAIISNKPQTTRNTIQTIHTDDKGQIVFIDTPGIHKSKNKLGDYMVNVAKRTLSEVDLILYLIEADTLIREADLGIIEELKKIQTPVILIINKIDTIKKDQILEVINVYKDKYNFKEIIPISALKGDNTENLIEIIYKYLDEGPMYYDEDTITDQANRQIVAELIREKALRLLGDEIPHGVAVLIEQMKKRKTSNRKTITDIEATIICEKESHKGMIIGKNGIKLKDIGTRARIEIEDLLSCKVNLKLWVKVKKDWRDSDYLVKNFGYNK